MMRYKICLLLIGFLAIGYAEQHPWQKPTVEGFGIYDEKLDYTEGFGAFMDLNLRPGTKNFDNGGGSHNYKRLLTDST